MKLTETFIKGDGTVTREYEGWTIDDIKAMRVLAHPLPARSELPLLPPHGMNFDELVKALDECPPYTVKTKVGRGSGTISKPKGKKK